MKDQFEALAGEFSRTVSRLRVVYLRRQLLRLIERLHDDISASVETSEEG